MGRPVAKTAAADGIRNGSCGAAPDPAAQVRSRAHPQEAGGEPSFDFLVRFPFMMLRQLNLQARIVHYPLSEFDALMNCEVECEKSK
jgi:hypothetical protein